MKSIKSIFGAALFSTLSFALIGCQPEAETNSTTAAETPAEEDSAEENLVRVAIAELQPTEGNNVSGTVTFTRVEGGIQVAVDLQGFEEGPSERGFHIHEIGDCSAPDATSAGGHFNPENRPHGPRDSEERHIGDLGNITVDADGTARKEFIDPLLTFDGPNSILERSVIVHAQRDDLESQPTGDAGGRVACGIIQIAEYEN
ncbi:MAG TPA: superoxide dismutase family protein [Opitutales bacterium]|nr:superoxide dismutase family protein [Opitutales bacterium]